MQFQIEMMEKHNIFHPLLFMTFSIDTFHPLFLHFSFLLCLTMAYPIRVDDLQWLPCTPAVPSKHNPMLAGMKLCLIRQFVVTNCK